MFRCRSEVVKVGVCEERAKYVLLSIVGMCPENFLSSAFCLEKPILIKSYVNYCCCFHWLLTVLFMRDMVGAVRGCTGSPVRIRHCPATVTAAKPARCHCWKQREDAGSRESGSQETDLLT